MKPFRCLPLTLLLISLAQAGQLPENSTYIGEIRRDSNGKLIAVPAPAPAAAAAAPATSAPPANPNSDSGVAPGPAATKATRTAASPAPSPTATTAVPATATTAAPRLIRVGPQQQVHNLSVAASMARDGDTIEVEAGDYVGDVAVWKQDRLTIRGIGKTRPRLIAAGANAEGKGIWVMRGGRITVENLEFRGARVPDHNGAGIRFEGGQLIVRNCKFEDNENGILTSGKPDMTLDIENSEFGNNGAGDGRTHNIYVGHIGRLRVSGIYSHHARGGHLLKSRALENFIFYNRLSDESGGHASYELEFPNGGIAYVVGNLIEQGSQTENSNIVSFGAEGYKAPLNMLYLVNNTIVDDRPTPGNPLAVKSGADKVVAMNNLLVTDKPFSSNIAGEFANNPHADWNDFVLPQRFDYRLKRNSALVGKYVNPPSVPGLSLIPQREYAHPAGTRPVSGPVRVPGALQDTGA